MGAYRPICQEAFHRRSERSTNLPSTHPYDSDLDPLLVRVLGWDSTSCWIGAWAGLGSVFPLTSTSCWIGTWVGLASVPG